MPPEKSSFRSGGINSVGPFSLHFGGQNGSTKQAQIGPCLKEMDTPAVDRGRHLFQTITLLKTVSLVPIGLAKPRVLGGQKRVWGLYDPG